MISPVLCAADAQQWFMSTAVIWQGAQRFKTADSVHANRREESLLLQPCTHQKGQWHVGKEIGLIRWFSRTGALTQTQLSHSPPVGVIQALPEHVSTYFLQPSWLFLYYELMQNRTAQESPSTEETAVHTNTLKHTFHPLSPFNFLLMKNKKEKV